jgi:hypothetical protein
VKFTLTSIDVNQILKAYVQEVLGDQWLLGANSIHNNDDEDYMRMEVTPPLTPPGSLSLVRALGKKGRLSEVDP